MKTKYYFPAAILFCLFSFITSLNSQIEYGVKAGAHLGNVQVVGLVDGILPLDTRTYIGETFGVFADIPLNNKLSFHPEINYTSKGFKFSEGIDLNILELPLNVGFTARTKFNYLEIPLLMKLNFETANGLVPYLMAGPSLNYATSANLRVRANVIAQITALNQDIPLGGVNRFNLAGVIGGGVAIPMDNGKLILDARYQHDLSNTVKTPIIDIAARNRGFAFNIGYALGF
ncbi:MAG: porin family protein [Bacteroidota bacterium]